MDADPRPEPRWEEAVNIVLTEEPSTGSSLDNCRSSNIGHHITADETKLSSQPRDVEVGSSTSSVDEDGSILKPISHNDAEVAVKEGSTRSEEDASRGTEGRPPRQRHDVGALQHIPSVQPSSEILASALRRAKHIKATKGEGGREGGRRAPG